jgi:WhiB family transcriptional regulator, redox-sensing transcriptional regulator
VTTATLAEVVAAAQFEVPPRTMAARIERAFLEREVARGERLNTCALARDLGCRSSCTSRVLVRLRARRKQDPSLPSLRTTFAAVQRMTTGELAELRERLRTKHVDAIDVGAWWQAAACGGMDGDLFFPPNAGGVEAARAKRVCAACPVRQQCLVAELAAPWERHGIVGGTAPTERIALRIAAGMPKGPPGWGRFLADQDRTVQAHRRAREVGITRAAVELDTDTTSLHRAFDRWGLPEVPTLPSVRFASRAEAAEAHALAVRVGMWPAARQLGVAWETLHSAFVRYGLPWPLPRPSVPTRRFDPAFFALNPAVLVPARLSRQAADRVRRAEDFEVLGARVLHALVDENQTRQAGRVHVVTKRARQAQEAVPPGDRDRDGQPGPHRRHGGTGTAAGTGRRQACDRERDGWAA